MACRRSAILGVIRDWGRDRIIVVISYRHNTLALCDRTGSFRDGSPDRPLTSEIIDRCRRRFVTGLKGQGAAMRSPVNILMQICLQLRLQRGT